LSLAQHHFPTIHQGYHRLHDIPCAINHEKFEPPDKPTIYYWVRANSDHYFLGYAVYHYLDWTNCPFGRLVGGQHRHDFEGILVRTPYYLPHHTPSRIHDRVTVCHNNLKYCLRDIGPNNVYIEARGHGIHAHAYDMPVADNWVVVMNPHFINLDKLGRKWWDITQKIFNLEGVAMPDQWGRQGYKGLLYKNPARLFHYIDLDEKTTKHGLECGAL
jgi:hypothetical protein